MNVAKIEALLITHFSDITVKTNGIYK